MWSLGAPWFFAAAAMAAVGVVALHFLAWRRPLPMTLPTARFVPATPLRAVSRDVRLSDVALLAVRVLALLLIGVALAEPRIEPRQSGRARVFLADRSRAVRDIAEVRDSLRVLAGAGGMQRVIWFDSVPAAPVDVSVGGTPGVAGDTTRAIRAERRGHLSAALVAAIREGERLARSADTVELVVVSPLAREEGDAALGVVRSQWQGALRVSRVAARVRPAPPSGQLRGPIPPVTDEVGAAMRVALGADGRAGVAAVRGLVGAADSSLARSGGVVLVWPDSVGRVDSAAAPLAVTTMRHTVIGAFARGSIAAGGQAVAWSGDGEVLAREETLGDGCLRRIAFAPPPRGDLALRESLADVVRDLAEPCGDVDWNAMDQRAIQPLTTAPSAQLATAALSNATSPAATRWLLVTALAALAGEWWLRRRATARREGAADEGHSSRSREAA